MTQKRLDDLPKATQMDKAKGGRIEGGRWEWPGVVGEWRGENETTVLEQQ